MITIFNRKEVYTTYSPKKLAEIRSILNDNNVDYRVDISGSNKRNISAVPFAVDRFGENNRNCQYRVFIHKKDYSKAIYLINNISRA